MDLAPNIMALDAESHVVKKIEVISPPCGRLGQKPPPRSSRAINLASRACNNITNSRRSQLNESALLWKNEFQIGFFLSFFLFKGKIMGGGIGGPGNQLEWHRWLSLRHKKFKNREDEGILNCTQEICRGNFNLPHKWDLKLCCCVKGGLHQRHTFDSTFTELTDFSSRGSMSTILVVCLPQDALQCILCFAQSSLGLKQAPSQRQHLLADVNCVLVVTGVFCPGVSWCIHSSAFDDQVCLKLNDGGADRLKIRLLIREHFYWPPFQIRTVNGCPC